MKTTTTKTCIKCGEEKPLTEYPVRKDSKDGFRNVCKVCKAIQMKAYCQENRETLVAKRKAYREANHEMIKRKKREAYWADPEKHRKIAIDYYWDNWETVRKRKARSNLSEEALAKARAKDAEYARANKEKRAEYRRVFYSDPENLRIRRERQQAHRRANPEHYVEKNRKWRQANLEKARAHENIKARRRKSAETDNHTLKELHAYWRANGIDPKRCTYCDAWHTKWANPWKTSQGDHVVPLAKGGKDFVENIVPCCLSCNSSKNCRILYEEWIPPKDR